MTFGSLRRAAFVAAFALVGTVAQAGQVSQTLSIPLTTTNWSDSLVFNQFDSSLGTLTSICFIVDGEVVSDFAVESLDAAPSLVTQTASAMISVTNIPSLASIVANAAGAIATNLDAFDGVIDFAGLSGANNPGVTGSGSSGVIVSTDAADFAFFTGAGTVALNVAATGLSNASGAGNLITIIQTAASADVTVIYKFDNTISTPEPATIVSLLSILPIVGFAARRRKTA